MNAGIERIGPEQANRMLETLNYDNRKMSDRHVERLAGAMLRNAWLENGSSIVVSDTGRLLDGQHRLAAIVRSGVSHNFVVVRGVKNESFSTIDVNAVRRLKDVLSIQGEAQAGVLSAALNVHKSHTASGLLKDTRRRGDVTFGEMLDYYDANPGIERSVRFVTSLRGNFLIGRGLLAGLHALFADKDERMADQFVEAFVTGTNIEPGSPLADLRVKMERDDHSRNGKWSAQDRGTALILAWNATRKGTKLDRFYTRDKSNHSRYRKLEIV